MEVLDSRPTPDEPSRTWGVLLGGIVGGVAGLFSGIACCLSYGLAGAFGTLVARAYLGDIKTSEGVKVGILSGIIGPLPAALLTIGFLKWATTLPSYTPTYGSEMEAASMTVLYIIIAASAIAGAALSVAGSLLAVFLLNYKKA